MEGADGCAVALRAVSSDHMIEPVRSVLCGSQTEACHAVVTRVSIESRVVQSLLCDAMPIHPPSHRSVPRPHVPESDTMRRGGGAVDGLGFGARRGVGFEIYCNCRLKFVFDSARSVKICGSLLIIIRNV